MSLRNLFLIIALIGGALSPGWAQSVRWSTPLDSVGAFSSPRAADLNQDGVKDIIVGGGIENAASPSGVIALDGITGQVIWNLPTRNHIFGTPLLRDITGDGIAEIFITGRGAQFYCLNGRDGAVIWEFWPDSLGAPSDSGWYHFYSPQWVPDQNNDGIPDLVVTNGGDATAQPTDTLRPVGYLLVVNTLDGQTLARDTMPDGKETYHSPLVTQFPQFSGPSILFGSGGETVRGKYWHITLSDFMQSGLAQAEVLVSDSLKGFIAVPSLVDLDANGSDELIVPIHNGGITALNGDDRQPLWTIRFPGMENYVSPVIGQFTGDATPDAFAIFAKGVWPFYSFFVPTLIDGATGNVVWQDTTPTYQLASGNALDWDQDGFDELLLIRNRDVGFYQVNFQNQFYLYDFNDSSFTPFSGTRPGLNVFTSPLIDDLDGDGLLDLVYTYHPQVDAWYNFEGFRVERMDLNLSVRPIAWGSYLGTEGDGRYRKPVNTGLPAAAGAQAVVYPNPGADWLRIAASQPVEYLQLSNLQGKILASVSSRQELWVGDLPAGLYLYRFRMGGDWFTGKWIHR